MKLTEVTKILELNPINGADRIERAKVLGWDVVVRKGLHQVGDTVIFVFPDTNIPKKFLDESYEGEEKVRLKTVKMKGQYSAGLILPLSVLGWSVLVPTIGDDVSGLLNIEKWEAPISPQLAGIALGGFPSIVSKTDEDNYRSNPEAIKELQDDRFKDQVFYATTKYDGSSATYILDPNGDTFRVCSRNLELKKASNNTLWKMADKYKIEETLRLFGKHYAIQGEIVGEGIQSNPIKLTGQHFHVFLIKDLNTNTWLSWDETVDFCRDSDYLLTVPELFRFVHNETSPFPNQLKSLQDIANKTTYDKDGKILAEGIVIRPVNPIPSNVLGKSWWSLKFINEIYDMTKG